MTVCLSSVCKKETTEIELYLNYSCYACRNVENERSLDFNKRLNFCIMYINLLLPVKLTGLNLPS